MDARTKGVAFFDTNVLVAASIPGHIHHEPSRILLTSLRNEGGACAAHSLAEAYNTLTKSQKGYGIPPADAARILNHASTLYHLVVLTPQETLTAIDSLAKDGLAGAIVYDALLLACARKIDASTIYTHNVTHFRQIAPDLAARIHLP